MLKKIYKIFFALVGASFAYTIGGYLLEYPYFQNKLVENPLSIAVFLTVAMMVSGIAFYLLSPLILKLALNIAVSAENELIDVPSDLIVAGVIGLIAGFLLAFLVSPLLSILVNNYLLKMIINLFLYGMLGLFGFRLGMRYLSQGMTVSEFWDRSLNRGSNFDDNKLGFKGVPLKILDTSVLIDGRIADIFKTGFIDGNIMIPEFVLEELQQIADSSDDSKRVRGRRGLDVVKKLQNNDNINLVISSEDFYDITEVDIKLLKLAKQLDAAVMTNDYNLNKLAQIQGIKILNLNQLSLALKSVVLPGEEMSIVVVKKGKEQGQGLAYLEDGTMIVIENGAELIGKEVNVIVAKVLQTAAGKMIFAKVKEV